MNTYQELIECGLSKDNAIQILDAYDRHIGNIQGMYRITDITYHPDTKIRDVELTCTACGEVIHRQMISGRNKWRELPKICDCERERQRKIRDARIQARKEQRERRAEVARIRREKKKEPKPPYIPPKKYDESYIGRRFGYLTITGITKDKTGHRAFACKCDCGNEYIGHTTLIATGKIHSCGCKHDEVATTHGLSKSRLYHVWTGMKNRCYMTSNPNYDNYGGRGIRVCDEWKNDFMAFHDWAYANGYDEDAPRGECTIDRIDVNGNYEPDNCRWADAITQSHNKRPSSEWKRRGTKCVYDGEEYFFEDLCEIHNTSTATVTYRMNKMGMTLEEALTMPKKPQGRPRKAV